jgi:peptidyl-dipeptidase A
MLHEFGHAVYDKYTDMELPHVLRGPTHIFTTEAIAMLFGRLSQSVDFLTHIVGKSEESTSTVAQEAQELFCQNQLIFVRWGLVVVYFERELYRDPEQDLDALWWKLVAELQHIPQPDSSPGGTRDPLRRYPDWAAKIHIATTPAYYQNYILGELLASQLSRHLLDSVLSGASSLVNQPEVGKFLQENVFCPGRTVPWSDLVKRATGEELNPAYFLAEVTARGQR